MLELILNGFAQCLEPLNLLAIFLAVPLGILVGALPGFGAATGLVLVLPITYSLEPGTALAVLTGIYIGAEYGGSISAILINTPGTPAAVTSAINGYPMALRGKARDALLVSNIAAFWGGIVGGIVMLGFMPILGAFVLEFGAGEIFFLTAAGLLLVGSLTRGNRLKGIISVCLGLFLTFVGSDSVTGFSRFDFGVPVLVGGIPMIAGLLAMFAVPQMLELAMTRPRKDAAMVVMPKTGVAENFALFKYYFVYLLRNMKWNLLRSSFIGLLGMIPGVVAAVVSMAAYTTAQQASKHPEEFGNGSLEGLAAPEAANCAIVGGSLVPVISLGIPTSPAAALFMSAIFMQGLTPGPNFLIKQGPIVYMLIASIFICAFVQLFLGAVTIGSFAKILNVSKARLFTAVIALCCIGAYSVRTLDFDVTFFIVLGLITYFLILLGMNMGAVILGAFLGTTMEKSFMEAMIISPSMGGLIPYFQSRPIAMTMMGLCLCYLMWNVWRSFRARRNQTAPAETVTATADGSVFWCGARVTDMVFFGIVLLLSIWLYTVANGFPFRSRLFPHLVLGATGLCSLLGIARCLLNRQAFAGALASPLARVPWKNYTILAVTMVLYAFGIEYLGFYPVTVVYVWGLSCVVTHMQGNPLSMRTAAKELLFAVIFAVAAYAIFTRLFLTPMTTGLLFD